MSLAETRRLGARLAAVLRGGDVLTLEGDLGVGKTTLMQTVGAAWGVPAGEIRSPTFALLRVHELGEFDLIHADLYRLTHEDEVESCGLAELLGALDCVCVVEWPALALRYLPSDTLGVILRLDAATGRRSYTVNPALERRLRGRET